MSSLPDSAQCAQSLSPRALLCWRPAHIHEATVHARSRSSQPTSGDHVTVVYRSSSSPLGSYTNTGPTVWRCAPVVSTTSLFVLVTIAGPSQPDRLGINTHARLPDRIGATPSMLAPGSAERRAPPC